MSFFSFSPELEHTIWIKPSETQGVFPLPVPPTEWMEAEIALTCTVPGPLAEARLVKAFEDSLTCYPHASGRLRRRGDSWAIAHGARGVPLTFMTTNEPFNHYEYLDSPPPRVVDSCVGAGDEASGAQWDDPLLRLRVTFCRTTNETTIGWSSSRMIGDAEFVYGFMHSLSQHYQHKSVCVLDRHTPSSASSFTLPVFELLAAATLAAQPELTPDEEHQLHDAILEALAPRNPSLNSTPSPRSPSKINLSKKWHFGYGAERTRVCLYGDNAEVGYLRYFTAPPIKLRDGVWESYDSDSNTEGVRVAGKEKGLVDNEEDQELVPQSFPRSETWGENVARARGREGERAKL
ncbi:hypothetical protein FB45DRAFT_923372 [Roridomyces roridus]|uniref:Uncharacterized protein n=1 Tax=Roridomyces roridus TaxID=1738132 RepID=A0AAD7BLM2_9AGAR|nr:hypothetical protein FB45DRAFT_923372 [Roridomyces roridus]